MSQPGHIRVKVTMSPRFADLLKNHEAKVANSVIPILNVYGAKMEKQIKQDLSVGGYGPLRKAKRKGGRERLRDYRASSPGGAPHLRTGALRSSIGFVINSGLGSKISLVIGSIRSGTGRDKDNGKTVSFFDGVRYSQYLDDKDDLNRPFLRPVVERYEKEISRTLRTMMKKIFGGK